MKIITTILLMLWLIFAFTSENYAQRNKIMYRPFDWQAIEIKNDSLTYAIYFPKGMEVIAALAQSDLEAMLPFYAERAFVSEWPVADTNIVSYKLEPYIGTAPGTVKKDSTTKKPLMIKKSWRPKELIILLYPNPQDFNQQQIADEFIPPGVGGFTELQRKRIAIPYNGDEHSFRNTLAHEVVHAFVMHYFTERGVANTRLGNMFGFNQEEFLPLWFEEGLAEFLAAQFMGLTPTDQRFIQHQEFKLFNILAGAIPASYNNFVAERDNDFAVYALGYTLIKHAFNGNERKIPILFNNVIGYRDFPKAWLATFGKSIAETYNEWYAITLASAVKTTLLSPADNAIADSITPLFKFQHIEQEPIFVGGSMNYDPISKILVGYEYDKKWGIKIVAFVNNERVEIAHQFENKSLFLKVYSPPAIIGRTIAIVLNKDGADKIYLYDLVGNRKPKARLREIINLPNFTDPPLIIIEDLYFANADLLFFAGTDIHGEKNVYAYDNARRVIWRNTHNKESERNPLVAAIARPNNLAYLQSSATGHERFCYQDSGIVYEARIGDETYAINRAIANEKTIYLQVTNVDGTSDILIWHTENPHAYRYRYGTRNLLGASDEKFVRGRLVEQLIGLTLRHELVIALNRQPGILPQMRFVKFAVDTSQLEKIPVSIEKKEAERTVLFDTTGFTKQIKRVAKFPAFIKGGNASGVTFDNPTGEQNLFVYGTFYYSEIIGMIGYGLAYYEDRSQRLYKGISIEGGRYFNVRLPLWIITGSASFDKTFTTTGIIHWPFNLEQSLAVGIGLGYLNRSYIFQPQKNFSSPTLRTNLFFIDDASFPDYISGSNHGHWYQLKIYQTAAVLKNRPNILDGAAEIDLRYYWRPWQTNAHLALRLHAGKNFGQDPYAFIDTDLYRIPGFNFYRFDVRKSIGENILIYQIEYRLPFTRILFMDYTFWENTTQKPFIILSVIPTLFLYGGGLSWDNKLPQFMHRYGLAVKIGLIIPYTYLRFERYRFLGREKWHNAMTIGIDY